MRNLFNSSQQEVIFKILSFTFYMRTVHVTEMTVVNIYIRISFLFLINCCSTCVIKALEQLAHWIHLRHAFVVVMDASLHDFCQPPLNKMCLSIRYSCYLYHRAGWCSHTKLSVRTSFHSIMYTNETLCGEEMLIRIY